MIARALHHLRHADSCVHLQQCYFLMSAWMRKRRKFMKQTKILDVFLLYHFKGLCPSKTLHQIVHFLWYDDPLFLCSPLQRQTWWRTPFHLWLWHTMILFYVEMQIQSLQENWKQPTLYKVHRTAFWNLTCLVASMASSSTSHLRCETCQS